MVLLLVSAAALAMIAVERLRPGREFPRARSWIARAIALNAAQVLAVLLAGIAWDPWMRERRPFSADSLGVAGGALAGYFAITLAYYAWHRARHEVPWLWRTLHQVHHSVERVEVLASFYKHPLEILANGVLSSAILYGACGLGTAAAGLAIALTGLAELFYHWNVRTPRWIGFLIQRPESHCIHHELGERGKNYSDLPLWDALFGTLENPREWRERVGLGPGSEERLPEMLRFVDVGRARRG
jgi:sterol desaturase/sphingolipid hydroxylase (fatty acid hydroxylase superfamily)